MRRQEDIALAERLASLAQRRLDTLAHIVRKLAAKVGKRPFGLITDRICDVELLGLVATLLILLGVFLRPVDHALLFRLREAA